MTTTSFALQKRSIDRHFSQQIMLAFFLITLAGIWFSMSSQEDAMATIGFMAVITLAGLWLIARLRILLEDPNVQRLGYVWLLAILLTLTLLFVGWIPQLDPSASLSWGYDPQRYYFQAKELIDNRWSSDFVSINYVGILYYYGALFAFIGYNPIIPALLNLFTTLLAVLFLVQIGYKIKKDRGPYDWTLGLAMLLPEVLWFDVMTSRETITMSLLTILLLSAGEYLMQITRSTIFGRTAVILITDLGIGLLRTAMLLPVAIAMGLLFLFLRPARMRRWGGVIFLVQLAVLLFVTPTISTNLGSYNFDYTEIGNRLVISDEEQMLLGLNWNQQSFGQLLIPNNNVEAILYTPPRAMIYLVTPLPTIGFSLKELLHGSWLDWQTLMSTLSSIINITLFPFALASFIYAIRHRKEYPTLLVFHIPYWVLFFAIAAGNQIIHERYRIMASLLFAGCVWLGVFATPRTEIKRWYFIWFLAIGLAGLVYIGYKLNFI